MRKYVVMFLIFLMVFSLFHIINVESAGTVDVNFSVKNKYWGTYNNPTRPSPGEQNVPLTIILRHDSDLKLRADGYLYLNNTNGLLLDHVDRDNVSYARGIAIDEDPDSGDIAPYGLFYFTFYLDISSNITKGEYNVTLRIEYNGYNDTGYYVGIPKEINLKIEFPNQPPVIISTSPDSASVTLYIGDSQTFSVRAYDPDNDSFTYTWRLDGDIVAKGVENYTFYATEDDLGSHTLIVEVFDGEDTTQNTWTISVEVNRITRVDTSSEYIIGGSKTPITINVTNNVWKGTVTIELNYPDYISIIGNTSWKFTNVNPGDTVTLSFLVYAPVKVVAGIYGEIELIGQTATLTLSISYTDYLGQPYDENQDIGFIIRGKQIIRVFDLKVQPNPAKPGDIIKVSAIVLNTGTYKALYGNFSIYSDILVLGYKSFYYIGDIDINAPIPVEVNAYIAPNATEGLYNITVTLYYQDDQYNEYYMTFLLTLNVTIPQEETSTEAQQYETAIAMAYTLGGLIAVVSIALFLFKRRKKSKAIETESSTEQQMIS